MYGRCAALELQKKSLNWRPAPPWRWIWSSFSLTTGISSLYCSWKILKIHFPFTKHQVVCAPYKLTWQRELHLLVFLLCSLMLSLEIALIWPINVTLHWFLRNPLHPDPSATSSNVIIHHWKMSSRVAGKRSVGMTTTAPLCYCKPSLACICDVNPIKVEKVTASKGTFT